jgi:hypothetical protein
MSGRNKMALIGCRALAACDDVGVFCISPRDGTFQKCATGLTMSAFLYVFDVSKFIRRSENRLMEHEMRHGNPRVTESRPSGTLGIKLVFRVASPINSMGIDQSVMRGALR